MPLSLILVPLLGVLVLNTPVSPRFRHALTFWFGMVVGALQVAVAFLPDYRFWAIDSPLFTPLLRFEPAADELTRVMVLAIGLVAVCVLCVGRASIGPERVLANFTNLVILAVAGMNGLVLAADLFTLYVFLEVTAAASFVLIALHGDRDAIEGVFKYIVLSAVASALLLSAVALFVLVAGSSTFADMAAAVQAYPRSPLVLVATGLLLAGLLIKGGVVPFHGWVPDAYSTAPVAVSVLLAGIVTKVGGIYVLIRLVGTVFGSAPHVRVILLVTGAVSIVFGALAALGQTDMKRMLAYSSISQVGYIVLGLGVASPLAMAGAVLHLFNHAVFKSLLFVDVAAVEQAAGTRDMTRLGGVAERLPITGTTSVIAMLSTAGIPPLAGFWSKLLIVVALWQAGEHGYAAVAILASLLTLAYFLVLQRRVFYGRLAAGLEGLREVGPWLSVPACALALITVLVGVALPWLFGTFLVPVGSIL